MTAATQRPRRRIVSVAMIVGLLLLPTPAPTLAGGSFLTLVASGYTNPVFVTNAGDARLFVVEKAGRIKIIGGGTFLDISSLVLTGSERGLLGLAFHPDFASNRLFYVNYTRKSDGATVIAEYRRSSSNANAADPASRRQVLVIKQPASNHNGGWLGFKGNYLYISTGDGGFAGDPGNRAQSKKSLLGKLLRINPLQSGAQPYTIPASNPYVGKAGKDHIWSRGLRNPWRCSFDRVTNDLWCGDVGENKYEEIDRHATGRATNFGWRLLEGKHYYKYPGRTAGAVCTSGCKTLPITEYSHGSFGGGNCSITGGYVSRRAGADLYGRYVFGDFCSGRIWTIPAGFAAGGSLPSPVYDADFPISSFGEGDDGKLYVVEYRGNSNGKIYRLTDS